MTLYINTHPVILKEMYSTFAIGGGVPGMFTNSLFAAKHSSRLYMTIYVIAKRCY